MKCDEDGSFKPVQCAGEHCFCIDSLSGVEVPGTRVSRSATPDCERKRTECPVHTCQQKCPNGVDYELGEDGCPTCRCMNPCSKMECKANEICVLAEVECLAGAANCPPQPRCELYQSQLKESVVYCLNIKVSRMCARKESRTRLQP